MSVRWIRRGVQVLFLGLFIFLLFHARREAGWLPERSAFLLRADPLTALGTALAGHGEGWHRAIPALVVLGLTVVLGRFFCGWVCPLGTCLDATDRLFRPRRPAGGPARSLKYYLLAAALVAALAGTQVTWLADPLPLLARVVSLAFYPAALATRGLAAPALHLTPLRHPGFTGSLLPLALFLGLLGLGYFAPRFWCRSLCPLGALVGVVGRFAPLRRRVQGDCTSCCLCEHTCKMGAIPAAAPAQTLTAECILCYNCVACRGGHTQIGLTGGQPAQAQRGTDTRKRALLASLSLGAFYGVVAVTGLGARRPLHGRLIRPPGANTRDARGRLRRMPESELRDRCVRCGACMRACPTAGLQPASVEAGWEGVFTPILVPRVGWCEQQCKACGQVCPTGALQPFSVEEKSHVRLGLATVYRDKCLAWRLGSEYRRCLVCSEVCSYGAVEGWQVDGELRPVVVADHCTGCGQCENKCPVGPAAAIVVYRSE